MKKIPVLKSSVLLSVLVLNLTGCGSKLAVNKDVGQLNLQYTVKEQKQKVDKKIAIVSPEFNIEESKPEPELRNPFTGQLIRKNGFNRNLNFNNLFKDSYEKRVSKSLNIGFEDLILKKGFTISGKYLTFDDMTYPERKSTYMALLPVLNLNIDKKVTHQETYRLYESEEGQIQVNGEFIIKMIEPLSKQMFITKRINLSDLNIHKPYIYEVQTTSSNASGIGVGSLISGAMDKATAPKGLRDTSDKALTEALNEFFSKSMAKIEKYLSQEEILSLENDVRSAKGKTGGTW